MWEEGSIRLIWFLGVFLAMALWEVVSPRRGLVDSKLRRWTANLGLVAVNTALVRVALPMLPVGMAVVVAGKGWGLLNAVPVNGLLKSVAALLLLDLVIYMQHLMFHYRPLLWRLHRMHHTDLDIDVTTGNRFHPLEIMISMLIKLAAVALIGAPPGAVLWFEVLLNAAAQFNHSNVSIPVKIDRYLRLFLVTPDMHRVHHSVIPRETNSNFGFSIPLWDRIFRTYREMPQDGHTAMTIGLREYRNAAELSFFRLLVQPFR